MHDPSTLAFDIKYPWTSYSLKMKDGSVQKHRASFISVWHEDPEADGTDDSCGWFMRLRHGANKVFERIVRDFEFDWDRVFVSDDKTVYQSGLFHHQTGQPVFSCAGTALTLFRIAAAAHFASWEKSVAFLRKNLLNILMFAENPTDSMHTSLTLKFGNDESRAERIRSIAAMIYGYILRADRPWYQHPRWHVWHWRLQIHPWQTLRRWLLTRCVKCGKRFAWGESPISGSWDRTPPKFLRGEVGLYHQDCSGFCTNAKDATTENTTV